MFLAGKKSTILKSETSKNITCPECNTQKSTKVSILGFYKHLFHVPFISGGKSGISECNKCKHKYNLKDMPVAIKLAYFELKETTKTPIWFFTGLIVIKSLVLIKIFSKYI
ncbi:hypothetical protein [Lutibacter citreus]|uniref:hypothetical protein n=1 Tax=Lutibacter citreus TaxID=2138210 RepID=UPI000DBE5464|nr:hypothetical protein [Lutibacter citreus]